MFGQRVKKLRIDADMTQHDLAQKLDISKSAVGMYEQNRREIPNDILIKLCNIFDVTSDWLLSGEGSSVSNDKSDLEDILTNLEQQLMSKKEVLFQGNCLTKDDIIRIFRAMHLGIEFAIQTSKIKDFE